LFPAWKLKGQSPATRRMRRMTRQITHNKRAFLSFKGLMVLKVRCMMRSDITI
jgi:hypothetical protein